MICTRCHVFSMFYCVVVCFAYVFYKSLKRVHCYTLNRDPALGRCIRNTQGATFRIRSQRGRKLSGKNQHRSAKLESANISLQQIRKAKGTVLHLSLFGEEEWSEEEEEE